ncbi:methionyl-tRNA formyltransferase, mitochondrial-like isoform X2 [Salvelinus fontinalis]|uniref:methionyl-tRNA formyltransferase, mitochondrial-like isoform X2 n=1 Tax=Salvelinus fontinalis TaxID=8038 RepID=UPI00248505DA|nr:methionyl-tRNA formyltransferase, mitochondrial-like isoform X2 [Salvelinus fontinalis]
MWNTVKAKVMGLKILHGFCNYCTQRHASVGVWVNRTPEKHRRCGQVPGKTRLFATRNYLSTEPPWRVLFFGTDDFAVESLKLLSASRDSNDRVVESLEVVILSNDVPVKKFADQSKLPVHIWPLGDLQGRFDVGVVVSFGCLLREGLINQFPWFDVGPILHQEIYQVPDNFTADQLGATLATKGAQLLIDTLRTLPERITNRREQAQDGATLAPKISTSMSWIVWEEQTCVQIDRLFRAIASRIPLRTIWMGKTIKLLEFSGKCNISLSGRGRRPVPGSMSYQKESNTLAVCCKDGWVGFKAVMLKKRLSAADFYNGYLHQSFQNRSGPPKQECLFHSNRDRTELHSAGEKNSLTQLHAVH